MKRPSAVRNLSRQKASTLLELGVKISRDSVRNVRKAFKAALKEERSFAKKERSLDKRASRPGRI